jgi:hypothetical protein
MFPLFETIVSVGILNRSLLLVRGLRRVLRVSETLFV